MAMALSFDDSGLHLSDSKNEDKAKKAKITESVMKSKHKSTMR